MQRRTLRVGVYVALAVTLICLVIAYYSGLFFVEGHSRTDNKFSGDLSKEKDGAPELIISASERGKSTPVPKVAKAVDEKRSHDAVLAADFVSTPNLASFVQAMLSNPTPTSLFYAREAYSDCVSFELENHLAKSKAPDNIGVNRREEYSAALSRLADEMSRCETLLGQYPDIKTFYEMLNAARTRLGGIDYVLPIDASGFAELQQGLATAESEGDPFLMSAFALKLAGKGGVAWQGKVLSEDEQFALMDAWGLARCELGPKCSTSICELRACLSQLLCSKQSVADFVSQTVGQKQAQLVERYYQQIVEAVKSGRVAASFSRPK